MQIHFSELEGERELKFRHKHWKKCKAGVQYIITPTGIGLGIVIQCKHCNKSKNITDVSEW